MRAYYNRGPDDPQKLKSAIIKAAQVCPCRGRRHQSAKSVVTPTFVKGFRRHRRIWLLKKVFRWGKGPLQFPCITKVNITLRRIWNIAPELFNRMIIKGNYIDLIVQKTSSPELPSIPVPTQYLLSTNTPMAGLLGGRGGGGLVSGYEISYYGFLNLN